MHATYIHIYIHTYVRTYILVHTYIHTYINNVLFHLGRIFLEIYTTELKELLV
jgi:hypothetical protein